MRLSFRRGVDVPADVVARAAVGRGDKVLAGARCADGGWLLGTRTALHLVPGPDAGDAAVTTVPWERVERAEWDRDSDRLRVVEVGTFGQARPVHVRRVDDPGLLLALVRERVTASVVLQRRVTVSGKRGLTVLARRSPVGGGELTWAVDLDPGVEPDDAEVRRLADAALRAAQEEIGGL